MSKKVNFLNFSVKRILSYELSILDSARTRLLYYGLLFSFFALSILFAKVLHQQQSILSFTTGFLLIVSVILFGRLIFHPNLRRIAHIILIVCTLANIIDIYLAIQAVNIVTIEVLVMILLFSFYMLGKKIGFIYSLLNIIPVVMLLLLKYNSTYLIPLKPEHVDNTTKIISIFACFILIVFIHVQFYTAFVKTIKELKSTSDNQSMLAAAFELAMDRSLKSSRVKSEFLATMSHEIRTPLNAVIGMSHLLIEGNPRPDQRENLEVLKYSTANLLSIVNDVLDFNKIESGKLVFENIKFNLAELMENICGGQMIAAQTKGVAFELDIDSTLNKKVLFGDPTRVTQIVQNLISNALKFTAQGSIWVRTTCIDSRHDLVTVNFTIKDTGIGIEQHRLDAIFEPFTQESVSSTREYGGTGLGLTIVKRLLELQGLKIKVTSQPGEGSEFSFSMEFPVEAEVLESSTLAQQLQQTVDQRGSLDAVRLLIVEDNPVNVLLMKKLLSKWNIVTSIAENGERAVELVRHGNFDIILMDLQMPVMNGFDAAKEIRKMSDPQRSGIPIIALTASALTDIHEMVHESGMNDYVSKPFKPNELLEKIHALIVRPFDTMLPGDPVFPQ